MNEERNTELVENNLKCFHCGDDCGSDDIRINEKFFCCNGCKTVYEILNENNLCNYYQIEETPGVSQRKKITRNYDFLEDPKLKETLIDFSDGTNTRITFSIPQMHCSSCIWILENLYKLNPGITNSKVDFLKKILIVQFKEKDTSLKEIVELMDSIGYRPDLNLEGKQSAKSNYRNKSLYYKIGVAGFAFGNIMLLSFPEYLSFTDFETTNLKEIFAYLNILLSLPVFFYSGSEYFISAYKGLRKRIVNIDVPISLGIIVLFTRSVVDIVFGFGPGYLDSLAALVFLLLVGRLFQNKTYDALNFERNYQAYFPIAVTKISNEKETTIPLKNLKISDKILVKSSELIPADSVLLSEHAFIDYSFVTGESNPVEIVNGDLVYAGGRQIGSAIEVEVVKEISQSYLTQLWNNKIFDKDYESRINTFVNGISKYFTAAIISIAVIAGIFWLPQISIALNVFTAVLIIACPCALALSTPFTLGNTLRIFGRNNFYVKNADVIERMSKVNHIVFDKTGTLTETTGSQIIFDGDPLTEYEQRLIKSLVRNSSHPLSRNIYDLFSVEINEEINDFEELPGKGIKAIVNDNLVQIGSKIFLEDKNKNESITLSTRVYVSINGKIKGFFNVANNYRESLKETIEYLEPHYKLSVLSGDNDSEKEKLLKFFNNEPKLLFRQSPQAKLDYIKKIQSEGDVVLMIGDGLNDAGALKQSDVGISISEDAANFSPSCDGILEAKSFPKLIEFIRFSLTSKKIIYISFIISFFYNVIGLGFAVQALLSPVIAAILMPLSSISVVVFTVLSTNLLAKKKSLI